MIIKYLLVFFMVLLFPVGLLSQEEEEENPHIEMVDDEFVCLDCHTDIPREGDTSPTYFLIDTLSEECLGCHDETQHPGAKVHQGQKAEPLPGDEKEEIACFTCHDPHPQGVIEGRTVYDADLSEREMKFINLIVLPNLKEELKTEIHVDTEKEVLLRKPFNKICITCHEQVDDSERRLYTPWYKFSNMYTY